MSAKLRAEVADLKQRLLNVHRISERERCQLRDARTAARLWKACAKRVRQHLRLIADAFDAEEGEPW